MIPRRTSSNPFHRNTTKTLLNELDILASILRQIFVLRRAHSVGLPPWKSSILDLDILQNIRVSGESGIGTSAIRQDVSNSDFDFVKVIQDIKLGQVNGSVVVNSRGVAAENEIEPATATTTAGCYTKFPSC